MMAMKSINESCSRLTALDELMALCKLVNGDIRVAALSFASCAFTHGLL